MIQKPLPSKGVVCSWSELPEMVNNDEENKAESSGKVKTTRVLVG